MVQFALGLCLIGHTVLVHVLGLVEGHLLAVEAGSCPGEGSRDSSGLWLVNVMWSVVVYSDKRTFTLTGPIMVQSQISQVQDTVLWQVIRYDSEGTLTTIE